MQESKHLAREVVVNLMTKPPPLDREHFLELIEERLLSLHANNLVRIKVRPSEFEAWWPAWSRAAGQMNKWPCAA